MNFHYKTLTTLNYQTHIERYLNGDSFHAEEAIIRSAPATPEEAQAWADSVRQQTPQIQWDERPYSKSYGRFLGSSGHAVNHKLAIYGKPLQLKHTT